jgi:hypothetical protein
MASLATIKEPERLKIEEARYSDMVTKDDEQAYPTSSSITDKRKYS